MDALRFSRREFLGVGVAAGASLVGERVAASAERCEALPLARPAGHASPRA